MLKKSVSMIIAAVLVMALAPGFALADTNTSKQSKPSSSLTTQSANYTVETGDYKFKIPKYWRGKVEWETNSSTGTTGVMEGITTYYTTIYAKGHMNDYRYLLAQVQSSRTYSIGPGLNFTSFHTGKKTVDDKVVYVTGQNWPLMTWLTKNTSTNYTQNMSKKLQGKMSKLSTGGKVTYKKALKSVKTSKALYYGGPQKDAKYSKAAEKFQKKTLFASLKVL